MIILVISRDASSMIQKIAISLRALESFGHVTQSRTNFSLKSWNDRDVLFCLLSNAFSLLYFPFSYQNKYCVVYLWWKAKCVQSLQYTIFLLFYGSMLMFDAVLK